MLKFSKTIFKLFLIELIKKITFTYIKNLVKSALSLCYQNLVRTNFVIFMKLLIHFDNYISFFKLWLGFKVVP